MSTWIPGSTIDQEIEKEWYAKHKAEDIHEHNITRAWFACLLMGDNRYSAKEAVKRADQVLQVVGIDGPLVRRAP